MTFLKLYCVSLIVFFIIDLVWLGIIAKNLYRDQIGFLMSDKVKWLPALIFYFLYIAGLVFFAILPAVKEENWVAALTYGGFFGLVCYATYDLTNLATLKGWPIKIAIYDLLWGAFISGVTSLITFWIGSHWKNYFS
ncbi:DUF2177 family protein [Criblamydia sequanensis]|uniref:Conserved putative membrane protein n=1 Tax=Candidatus Criblamydia sequanensis CRIB-18 TaxID=1437425 RepID=A0A090D2Q5_9BACT|nr:DUF2177 family protein [Criblamydia sequanensis]CDR34835.1 Conserved putative membrane protein [Criblamydia sequanensis CRIB-18]